MTTIVLAIQGMHCASCGMLIDEAVEELAGVRRSSTDTKAERTTVELDGAGAGPPEVVAAIEAEGYTASLVQE